MEADSLEVQKHQEIQKNKEEIHLVRPICFMNFPERALLSDLKKLGLGSRLISRAGQQERVALQDNELNQDN